MFACDDVAALNLAQLRATYLKEALPKYQYFGSPDEIDFGAALEEDADAGIAFVQTSAQMVTKGSSALVVDADGSVTGHSSPSPKLPSSGLMAVSADGRMHVEM
ncbi:unnamed protein product [Effrenium voratum]|nr:unnamed protein product [Effrenium voratum]